MALPRSGYQLIDSTPEGPDYVPDEKAPLGSRLPPSPALARVLHWLCHVLCMVVILVLAVPRGQGSLRLLCGASKLEDGERSHAPAAEALQSGLKTIVFQGTFLAETPYKGPPSEAVNEAWSHIMDFKYVNVTAEQMIERGRSLDSVQFPRDMGGGYLGLVEVAHHLHCLNSLWRDHHISYFPDTQADKESMPYVYELHFEHCVDMLRQRLMCTGDTELITFNWLKHVKDPYPNFNTPHSCSNYEDIIRWNHEHEVEIADDHVWTIPDDAVLLQHAP